MKPALVQVTNLLGGCTWLMSFDQLIVVVLAVLVAFLVAYRLKPFLELSVARPALSILPKYLVSVHIPESVILSQTPSESLESMFCGLDFKLEKTTASEIRLVRGSVLGDFSLKIAKVRLSAPLPLLPETELQVEYGAFAAFDTGDLWTFCRELQEKVGTSV
jgi:hypothetical protein